MQLLESSFCHPVFESAPLQLQWRWCGFGDLRQSRISYRNAPPDPSAQDLGVFWSKCGCPSHHRLDKGVNWSLSCLTLLYIAELSLACAAVFIPLQRLAKSSYFHFFELNFLPFLMTGFLDQHSGPFCRTCQMPLLEV